MGRFMEGWVLPALDDTNRDFFTRGQIVVRECAACRTVQHPPEDVCHSCGGQTFELREVAATGTLYSYTVVRHPIHPGLVDRVPYIVAVVSLDDLPEVRLTANLLETPAEAVRVGMAVRAVWEEIPDPDGGETIRLLQWVPAGDGNVAGG